MIFFPQLVLIIVALCRQRQTSALILSIRFRIRLIAFGQKTEVLIVLLRFETTGKISWFWHVPMHQKDYSALFRASWWWVESLALGYDAEKLERAVFRGAFPFLTKSPSAINLIVKWLSSIYGGNDCTFVSGKNYQAFSFQFRPRKECYLLLPHWLTVYWLVWVM